MPNIAKSDNECHAPYYRNTIETRAIAHFYKNVSCVPRFVSRIPPHNNV